MASSTFLEDLKEAFYAGEPEMAKWFLIRNNYLPLMLSCLYLLSVKVILPAIMKDRKPFELRLLMVVYNFLVVAVYMVCVENVLYVAIFKYNGSLCGPFTLTEHTSLYPAAYCVWIIYLLKYVEFLDTIFFIMRKKDCLVTNLHVSHHFLMPLIIWFLLRTERSGFQAFLLLLNSVVHIIMYTYYGLAAMGSTVRKYLWWKRYLTVVQMVQFVLMLTLVVIVLPLTGCTSSKASLSLNICGSTLFLVLFYNFYKKTFNKTSAKFHVE